MVANWHVPQLHFSCHNSVQVLIYVKAVHVRWCGPVVRGCRLEIWRSQVQDTLWPLVELVAGWGPWLKINNQLDRLRPVEILNIVLCSVCVTGHPVKSPDRGRSGQVCMYVCIGFVVPLMEASSQIRSSLCGTFVDPSLNQNNRTRHSQKTEARMGKLPRKETKFWET